MSTGSFSGGKEQSVRDSDPSAPYSAVGHERVELYLYSPSAPYGMYRASVPVQGCTLLFTSFLKKNHWMREKLQKIKINSEWIWSQTVAIEQMANRHSLMKALDIALMILQSQIIFQCLWIMYIQLLGTVLVSH